MLKTLRTVIYRDLLLALRRRSEIATVVLFFVIVVSLFPFGIGPESSLLRAVGPGVLWVAALLASMLALGRMFASDHADGTLEQMLLSPAPLSVVVLGKVAAHWLLTGLPLVVLAPMLALQFDVPREALGVLVVSLALGTPGAFVDRRDRRGIDAGRAGRRRADGAARAAAVHTGADTRGRRGRPGGKRARRQFAPDAARRALPLRARLLAVADRRGAPHPAGKRGPPGLIKQDDEEGDSGTAPREEPHFRLPQT